MAITMNIKSLRISIGRMLFLQSTNRLQRDIIGHFDVENHDGIKATHIYYINKIILNDLVAFYIDHFALVFQRI